MLDPLRRALVPRRHGRLRGQPERVRRAGARPLRAGAGGQPRPRRHRPRRLLDLLERRRPRDPLDARGAVRRRRDVAGRLEPTAQRGPIGLFHASPRDPVWEYVADAAAAKPPYRARRTSWCWPHARAAGRPARRRAPDRRAGRRRLHLRRARRSPHAAQSRLGRPAARRRRAGRLAAALPRRRRPPRAGDLPARPLRHRRGAAGDRGRGPAAAPRRPPLVRHVRASPRRNLRTEPRADGAETGANPARGARNATCAPIRGMRRVTRRCAPGARQLRRCAAVSACSAACRPRRRTIVSRARKTRRRTSS